MRNCFIDAILPQKDFGEIRMCDIVMCGNGERVSPECFAVTPIGVLNPGQPRESGNYYCGCSRKDLMTVAPRHRQVCCSPGRHQIKADMREIGVAVRPRLSSDLRDSNYGHKHSDVPEPPGHQVSMPLTKSEHNCRNACQECDGCGDFPKCQPILGMRINECQVDRKNHLPDVGNVAHKRVLDSPQEG